MATAAENLQTAYDAACAAYAAFMSDPKPNYTVDGVTYDRVGYARFLADQVKAARELLLSAQGPFEVVSRLA